MTAPSVSTPPVTTPSVAPVTRPAMLAATFSRNMAVLHANLMDLDHDDSLVQPSPKGNCLNWVVGHVLATRNSIFATLEQPPAWDETAAQRYGQGSDPITRPDEAQPLGDMMTALDRSQERLSTHLASLPSPALTKRVGERTLAEALESFAWHEAYHVGQTILLRRLVGR